MREQRNSLSAEDWAAAALKTIATQGVEALAVERLARELGVTKGSFYWHFANRDALLEAALELWERKETEDVLARANVDNKIHPRTRIARVFAVADATRRAGKAHLALTAAAAKNERIEKVMQRVSKRRLAFLKECYEALGLSDEDAGRWSTMAYSVFLGTLQVRREQPDALPEDASYREYMQFLIRALIPDTGDELPQDFPAAAELMPEPKKRSAARSKKNVLASAKKIA